MKLKLIVLLFLLVIANIEWIFIWLNYDIFVNLQTLNVKKDIKKQELYVEKLKEGVSLHLEKNEKNTNSGVVIHLEPVLEVDWIDKFVWFKPYRLTIPSLELESPVFNSNKNVEESLDNGVFNFSRNKDWLYIFWHSSSKKDTNYSYVFSNITSIWKGDLVFLEDDKYIKTYKYKDFYIKKPDKLDLLEDNNFSLYLITCYPFNTSIARYVVKLELVNTFKKIK